VKPESWREDGWPICPVCGDDELGDLTPMDRNLTLDDLKTHDLFCYRCGRVTVKAGEGASPA
jgi:hypothetical protein